LFCNESRELHLKQSIPENFAMPLSKIIIGLLTLAGAIGLFLFGMKLMSESLQRIAGSKLRTILAKLTANKSRGILTGLGVTSLVQSSGVTTVLIVSFVNAGLLSAYESLPLIMGANIGTTIKAWLIAYIGYSFNLALISLPVIGIGFPLLFSSNRNLRSWGEFLVGLALMFLALQFLLSTIPDFHTNPEAYLFLSSLARYNHVSLIIFFFAGMLFSGLIQSSSAAIFFTTLLCDKGWIGFDLAAAMVLGENIGTTITANISALVANSKAKTAARAHFVFNFLGVLWALPLIPVYLPYLERLAALLSGESTPFTVASIPVGIALLHTSFNLINTLLLVNFVSLIVRISSWLILKKDTGMEVFEVKRLRGGIASTPELSILQIKKEISLYAKRTIKMFRLLRELFATTNANSFDTIVERIHHYENSCDHLDKEITRYLTGLAGEELSRNGSRRISIMLNLVDEIESIGDSCFHIARTLKRKKDQKIWFTQELRNKLNHLFDLIESAFSEMNRNLDSEYHLVKPDSAMRIEKEINALRNALKAEQFIQVETPDYTHQAGIFYSDLISQCERLGDFICNITLEISAAGEK
jgi:phosphate:Na+ symporter